MNHELYNAIKKLYNEKICKGISCKKELDSLCLKYKAQEILDYLDEIIGINEKVRNRKSVPKKYLTELDRVINSVSNPINDDFIMAMLNMIMNSSILTVRYAKPSDYKDCINNQPSFPTKKYSYESMFDAIDLALDYYNNSLYDRINPEYLKFIKKYYNELTTLNEIDSLVLKTNYVDSLNNSGFYNFLTELHDNAFSFYEEMPRDYQKGLFKYSGNMYNDFRLYMNMPKNDITSSFLRDYQIICHRLNIPCNMKPFFNSNSADKTIIYSSYENLIKNLKILNLLFQKYGDLGLGTPPIGCGRLEEFANVGISHLGEVEKLKNKQQNFATYNDYIDDIFCVALLKVLSSFLLNNKNVRDKEIIKKFLHNQVDYQTMGVIIEGNTHIFASPRVVTDNREIIIKYLKILLNDPLKKKAIIDTLKIEMQHEHDLYQGFCIPTNIAVESWITESKRANDKRKENNYEDKLFDAKLNEIFNSLTTKIERLEGNTEQFSR